MWDLTAWATGTTWTIERADDVGDTLWGIFPSLGLDSAGRPIADS